MFVKLTFRFIAAGEERQLLDGFGIKSFWVSKIGIKKFPSKIQTPFEHLPEFMTPPN